MRILHGEKVGIEEVYMKGGPDKIWGRAAFLSLAIVYRYPFPYEEFSIEILKRKEIVKRRK